MRFLLKILCALSLVCGALSTGRVRRDCHCGEANVRNRGRIVNGQQTTPHKYPWLAAMFTHKEFMCGGSIISDRNILTAGHCVFYVEKPLSTYWVLGMHSQIEQDGDHYYVEHITMHPRFINFTVYDDYDMAIVTVRKKIRFSKMVSPICLTLPNSDFTGKRMIVAGWGRLDDTKDAGMGTLLQETRVRVKSQDECAIEVSRLVRYNDDAMICAHERGTDSCSGDSGGPLFVETDPNRYETIGVVSFGDGCARDFPGIYGKLSDPETHHWIKQCIVNTHGDICSDPTGKIRGDFFNNVLGIDY